MSSRIDTAVSFLQEGKFFNLGDISLDGKDPNAIKVIGWTQFKNIENLSKQQCLDELTQVKNIFAKMIEKSSRLNDYINGKNLEYWLYYDDYGKGSIGICYEKNNVIAWEMRLKA
jgi:hypothetical protein